MPEPSLLSRRSLFGLAAGGVLSGYPGVPTDPALASSRLATAETAPQPLPPLIEVAGPPDSVLGAWARQLQDPLAAALAPGDRVRLRYGSGTDGVIAANRFDALVVPDGRDALLFAGSVASARLTGEGTRVQMDPGHLLPVMAARGPGLLMARADLPGPGIGVPVGGSLRLAVGNDPDAELTALLGLSILGIQVATVKTGFDSIPAVRDGTVDAVFVRGANSPARLAALAALGLRPILSAEARAGEGVTGAMPRYFLAGLPKARLAGDPLVAAWRAMASACTLCAVLAVPKLTPAASIDRWRRAALQGAADPAVASRADAQAWHLVAGGDAAGALAPTQIGAGEQITLRRWIAARHA